MFNIFASEDKASTRLEPLGSFLTVSSFSAPSFFKCLAGKTALEYFSTYLSVHFHVSRTEANQNACPIGSTMRTPSTKRRKLMKSARCVTTFAPTVFLFFVFCFFGCFWSFVELITQIQNRKWHLLLLWSQRQTKQSCDLLAERKVTICYSVYFVLWELCLYFFFALSAIFAENKAIIFPFWCHSLRVVCCIHALWCNIFLKGKRNRKTKNLKMLKVAEQRRLGTKTEKYKNW